MIKAYSEKLKDLCCTLEQGKKLHELGIVKDSLFYYYPYDPTWTDEMKKQRGITGTHYIEFGGEYSVDGKATLRTDVLNLPFNKTFSAFTSGELGEFLQIVTDLTDQYFFTSNYSNHDGCHRTFCEQRNEEKENAFEIIHKEDESDTEAQSRAEMLIWLLENKIILVNLFEEKEAA